MPVSGFDHLVNQVEFLHDGRLLVAVGGSTNSGWPSSKEGGLFDSPLSSAVLAANVSKPNFDGHIKYKLRANPRKHPYYDGYLASKVPRE